MIFEPTLESVRRHVLPEWFARAKLGIFIHWGLYSVPAWAPPGQDIDRQVAEKGWSAMFANNPYAEWYQNTLRIGDTPTRRHHVETYGADFPYENFAADFNRVVEAWNPDDMAQVFSQVGARYVVLTSKHHEGFLLWPSARTSPKQAPGFSTRRDIVGELTSAVRRHGMRMGLYYSGGLDWTFNQQPVLDLRDVRGTIVQSPEFIEYVNAHFRELIDRYAPSVLWNDIGYPAGGHSPELFAYYYNTVPEGVINDRWSQKPGDTEADFGMPDGGLPEYHSDYTTPEYATYPDIQPRPWEVCRGIGHSFGYNQTEGPDDYLSVEALVRMFVDVVSKNGNLLLNVGPMANGTIPALQRERLVGLGDWLAVNGDAIFDTTPWTVAEGKTADGIDVRFTQKAGSVYAILLDTPRSTSVTLENVAVSNPQSVQLLGHAESLTFAADARGLTIELPGSPAVSPAHAFKIGVAK